MAAVLSRAPRWLSLLLGLACLVLGVVLVIRPLASLSTLVLLLGLSLVVSGIADLLTARPATSRLALGISLAWVAAGIAVLAWPGITVRALALIAGVGLIANGVGRAIDALLGGEIDERIASASLGVASVVFGILALVWPDVTVLAIAVIFGARTIWFGLTRIWWALEPRRATTARPAAPRRRGWLWRSAHVAGALVALVAAVPLAGVTAAVKARPPADDFYSAPSHVPSQAGRLLRSEPFHRDVPSGAQAWRILYTTTLDDRRPALASGIVVAPSGSPPGPLPVIAWAHGTTGFATRCAPSLLPDPFTSGALFVLDRVIAQGWALVATDYPGLGTGGPHPYLVGQGEARSVLDAVRAARQLGQVSLADRTVVWGHSQGGHAALWAGALAHGYAPDVDVVGVAALAPASDLVELVANLSNITAGSVFAAFVMAAYTRIYSDVTYAGYIRAGAQVVLKEMATRCLSGPEVFVSILSALGLARDPAIFTRDPTTGAFGARLRQNVPTGAIEAPLLVAQGQTDPLVLPGVQQRYAGQRCADGQQLEYRTYPDRDHVGLVTADSPLIPDLVGWTQARFAAAPATSNCASLAST